MRVVAVELAEVLSDLDARRSGRAWIARCPLHDDRHPSLSVVEKSDGLVRVTCWAGCDWKQLREHLGLDRGASVKRGRSQPYRDPSRRPEADEDESRVMLSAARVWQQASLRAQQVQSGAAIEYMRSRGLGAGAGDAFGVLTTDEAPACIKHWIRSGHVIVAPLHDQRGAIVSIQGRTIFEGARAKTLNPPRISVRGRVFANRKACALLKGAASDRQVFVGEGLTDHVALSLCVPDRPVLSVAGVSNIDSAIGPWVRGREIVLALDCDEAGEKGVQRSLDSFWRAGATSVQRLTWPQNQKDVCDTLRAQGGLRNFRVWLEEVSRGEKQ